MKLIKLLQLLSVILLLCAWDTEIPYYSKKITQPDIVTPLYPSWDAGYDTPSFQKEGPAFTTQEEMAEYLEQLHSPFLDIQILGQSEGGLDIPALYFSSDHLQSRNTKPLIWIQAQVHGNEPAAGEALLALASRLTKGLGREVLDRVDLVLVPRVNPDGSLLFTRELISGKDGNRDHMRSESKEITLLHQEIQKLAPDMFVDVHEYTVFKEEYRRLGSNGMLRYHDILLQSGQNLNIPESIRHLSETRFIKPILKEAAEKQLSAGRYYTMSVNEKAEISVIEGSHEARLARNYYGLQAAVSLLAETRGIGLGREDFPRRIGAQLTILEKAIRQAADNAALLKKTVAAEKSRLLKDKHRRILYIKTRDRMLKGMTLPMVDLSDGKVHRMPALWYSPDRAVPAVARKQPHAYILEKSEARAIQVLERHGLRAYRTSKPQYLDVQAFISPSAGKLGESFAKTDPELISTKIMVPAGSFVYPVRQPQGLILSLLLEPESSDSLTASGDLLPKPDGRLPVYRLITPGKSGGADNE